MSAPPGWYPDPAGAPGQFRYWDGSGWSSVTSPHPAAPPPSAQPYATPSSPGRPSDRSPARRGSAGWIIGVVAVVVVVAIVGVLGVRQITRTGGFGGGTRPPSSDTCPSNAPETTPPQADPADGRVHGGRLSYPRLAGDWDAPNSERRIPFGRDVQGQFATIERGDFLGYAAWGADVVVGELAAGDGFFAPKDGVAIVLRCVVGTFYGDTQVTRDDRRSEALTVDGHQAWVVETNLGFDVPNLQAKHELLIVVVIDIGDGTAGLFLASLPENGPQYVPQARRALAQLQVSD